MIMNYSYLVVSKNWSLYNYIYEFVIFERSQYMNDNPMTQSQMSEMPRLDILNDTQLEFFLLFIQEYYKKREA